MTRRCPRSAEEFVATPEEAQRLILERAFAKMYAAVNEERGDDLRQELSALWLLVRGRRLARMRRVVAAFEDAAEAEGIAESAAASDFASGLDRVLDELTSTLEEDEASGALLPDDTVYRTFTLNENLMGLAERHLQQRGTTDTLPLLELLRETLVGVSRQTPSGTPTIAIPPSSPFPVESSASIGMGDHSVTAQQDATDRDGLNP